MYFYYYEKNIVGDEVPNERPLPNKISIPVATFIANSKHWQKNRKKKKDIHYPHKFGSKTDVPIFPSTNNMENMISNYQPNIAKTMELAMTKNKSNE